MKIIRKNIWRNYTENIDNVVKWSFWNDFIPYEGGVICFNTSSGAIVLFDAEEYSKYKEKPSLLPDTFAQFGIIVSGNLDEKQEWCAEYRRGKEDASFLDLTILSTQQCQFKCVYCFEGEKGNKTLTDETSAAIKSFLEKRAGTFNKLRVAWFGGEPLLEVERIRELSAFFLDFCKKHNISYYADVTTNGYALNPSKCEIFFNECNIKRYIITVDGIAAVHDKRRPLRNGAGTFDVIWNNIVTLVNIGAGVTIRVTIDKVNAGNVKELIDRIAESEIARKTGLMFVRTIDYLYTPDSVKDTIYKSEEFAPIEMELIEYAHSKGILEYATPRPCPLGGCLRKGDIVIGTKGEIYKCLDTVGEEQWITGDISGDNENSGAGWYRDWLSWEPSANATCAECKLQPLCNGGCPHNALFASKKHGTDTQCPDWKFNYKKNVQLYTQKRLQLHEYQEV